MAEPAPRRIRLIGALDTGPLAPRVGQVEVGTFEAERVVLRRPADRAVSAAVRRAASAHLVAEREVVQATDGSWAVFPWIPGVDGIELRSTFPDGLPSDLAAALVLQIVRGLKALEGQAQHHGAVRASQVRVGPDGVVRLLGARGGTAAGDLEAVRALLESWVGLDDGHPVPEPLAPLLDAWPCDLDAIEAALLPLAAGVDVPSAIDRALASAEPVVVEHPSAGTVISQNTAPPAGPSKVRLSAVGGLTLLLGIGFGILLGGFAFDEPGARVVVQGATDVRLDCDPFERSGPTLALDVPTTCRVFATMPDGGSLQGTLDGSLTGRYQCQPDAGELRCSER